MEKFTHKGWIGLCPIYAKDLDTDYPALAARRPIYEPLLDVSEFIFGVIISVRQYFNPDYEPMFGIRITGEGEFTVE